MDERINDDSREKLEADVRRATEDMERFSYGERFINTNLILRWLDRQAAITASANAELIERQAKTIVMLQELVDEYDDTDMELPKDADGEYIRIGDTVVEINGTSPFKVMSLTYYENRVDVSACGCDPRLLRHVNPRTIEEVLADFAQEMNENLGMYTSEAIDAYELRDANSETVKKYAAEIREIMEDAE